MTAGFGLEKLGLLTARYPRTTLLIIAASLPIFLFFAARIEFNSDIREIFRSDSKGFAVLEEVTRQYPGAGRDILLVVEGDDIFTPKALNALRFLHLDLSLVPDVKYVLSVFSARNPPDAQGNAESVFPPQINEQSDMESLRKRVLEHPLVVGKLVSDDAKMALVVIIDTSVTQFRQHGVHSFRSISSCIGYAFRLGFDSKCQDGDVRLTEH